MSFVLVSGVDVCGITCECDGSMVFRKGVHRYQVVLNIWSDDSVSYIQRHCRSVDLLVADVCDGVRCVSSLVAVRVKRGLLTGLVVRHACLRCEGCAPESRT